MGGWLQAQWFQRRLTPALWLWLPLLLPLHALFVLGSAWRRWRTRPVRLPVPVVVVGNLTVGGAGKTPLTLWLARELAARGRRPGIVSRGYGGSGLGVRAVTDDALRDGDEPVLLARRSGCPVWVGRDRAAAGAALLAAHPEVDVLLCDDGLQHWRLARDVEIAVFDVRGAGNGWRLPLGPLRESLSRLATVDAVVGNGLDPQVLAAGRPAFAMRLEPGRFCRVDRPAEQCEVTALLGRELAAVAGIGHPARFFAALAGLGVAGEMRAFPDHHRFSAADLAFVGDRVLLMTEKDAVKCAPFIAGEAWFLPVDAVLSPALVELVQEKIRGRQVA